MNKPQLGLTGLVLASVALSGCEFSRPYDGNWNNAPYQQSNNWGQPPLQRPYTPQTAATGNGFASAPVAARTSPAAEAMPAARVAATTSENPSPAANLTPSFTYSGTTGVPAVPSSSASGQQGNPYAWPQPSTKRSDSVRMTGTGEPLSSAAPSTAGTTANRTPITAAVHTIPVAPAAPGTNASVSTILPSLAVSPSTLAASSTMSLGNASSTTPSASSPGQTPVAAVRTTANTQAGNMTNVPIYSDPVAPTSAAPGTANNNSNQVSSVPLYVSPPAPAANPAAPSRNSVSYSLNNTATGATSYSIPTNGTLPNYGTPAPANTTANGGYNGDNGAAKGNVNVNPATYNFPTNNTTSINRVFGTNTTGVNSANTSSSLEASRYPTQGIATVEDVRARTTVAQETNVRGESSATMAVAQNPTLVDVPPPLPAGSRFSSQQSIDPPSPVFSSQGRTY